MELTPFEFMKESFPKARDGELKAHLTKTSISSATMNTRRELKLVQHDMWLLNRA